MITATHDIAIPAGRQHLAEFLCREITSDFPGVECTITINQLESILRVKGPSRVFLLKDAFHYLERLTK